MFPLLFEPSLFLSHLLPLFFVFHFGFFLSDLFHSFVIPPSFSPSFPLNFCVRIFFVFPYFLLFFLQSLRITPQHLVKALIAETRRQVRHYM
jgi:hypothetical protein